MVMADSCSFADYLRRDLSALARIIADNSTAALAFNDPDSAAQTLGALRARTHVVGACIYRMDGTILASYSRPGAFACPPPERPDQIRFTGEFLIVAQPILLRGRAIGTLMLLYDLGEINERIRLYGSTVLGVLLASSSCSRFLLSSRLRSVIATPISRLVSATTSVSETGDYSIRAEKLSGDELGVLVDRFNEMLAGIQSRDNDLKKALSDREAALQEVEKERERFALHGRIDAAKDLHRQPDRRIAYLNRQWMDFTGLSIRADQRLGLDAVHSSRRSGRKRAGLAAFHRNRRAASVDEHRFRRADGVYRWHLNRARAMRNADGEIILWIGSSTDIHEQKEKEEELRSANDDLQQFAYSASHDLQEPIRNVAVYSEIVARRYHSVLDAEGRQFLGFLREGGRRLATLVNDLLAYTRASMAELSAAPVDSHAPPCKNALASLAEAIRESDAKVTYDALPEVYMGEAHLQQVLQNLIGNAIKYRNEESPRIHISAANRGGHVALFGARQRHRHRPPVQGENLWRIQAAPS